MEIGFEKENGFKFRPHDANSARGLAQSKTSRWFGGNMKSGVTATALQDASVHVGQIQFA
jgi:hypothetical protein